MASTRFHRRARVVSILFLGCLGLVGLLTSCAPRWERVTIVLEPRVNAPLGREPTASLQLGKFKDSRLDVPPYIVLYNLSPANPFKAPARVYVTNSSVATILRDGLADALGQNGFKTIGGPSDEFHNSLTAAMEQSGFKANRVTSYQLCGDIQSSGCLNIQRLFARSIIKTWLTVRFDLVDPATGLTVWHDTYTGQDTATNHSGGEFFVTAFTNVSEDVIRQLVVDRTFRNYFEP
jgi:hypothetical protein